MTRKKVKLAFITNDSARKATFKKRKKGLIKKVSELSTLCGVNACLILYSPYDGQPDIWPSPMGVHQVIADFKGMSEMDQSKKMVNQESFLKQRINKASEQLRKQRRDNHDKEITQILFESLIGKSLSNLNMGALNDLAWMIHNFSNDVQKNIDKLMNSGQNSQETPSLDIKLNAMDDIKNSMKEKSWFVELGHGKMISSIEDNNNDEKDTTTSIKDSLKLSLI